MNGKNYETYDESKIHNFITDEVLATNIESATSDTSGKYKLRDFVAPLVEFCTDNCYNGKIGIVYGLRSTGKTVGMLQAAEILTERGCKVAYARFNYEESGMRDANAEIKRLIGEGFTHFFIDEATYLGGFLNLSAEWADSWVPQNRIKIIISGTDSFLLWLARGTSLFHRYEQFSTNWNSFAEYKRITGNSYDEYKTAGGIFTIEPMPEFIRAALVENLIRSIEHYFDDANRTNEYTSRLYGIDAAVIYKAVISILKCAVELDLKRHFMKNANTKNIVDLGNAVSGWSAKEKHDIKERVAESLAVYEDFIGIEKPKWVIEVLVEFLMKIGCLTKTFTAPSDFGGNRDELYYFSHNAIMYYAVEETIGGVLSLGGINKDEFTSGIKQAAEGYLNESIVFAHVLVGAGKDDKVFKYRDAQNREVDIVVINRETNTLRLIEVKSTNNINDKSVFIDEARHLYDDEILDNIGVSNSFTVSRIVVYKGENHIVSHEKGDLLNLNIEDFISHSDDLTAYLTRIYKKLTLPERDKVSAQKPAQKKKILLSEKLEQNKIKAKQQPIKSKTTQKKPRDPEVD